MKECQEKAYTFHLDDLESLFRQTIEYQDIILPKSKRPTEADKVNDPKYCKYHCILGHTLQDCFMFKDKLQELINKNTVELDVEIRVATTNAIFTDKDMVGLVSIQDNGDDKSKWAVIEGEMIQKRRLQAVTQKRERSLKRPMKTTC